MPQRPKILQRCPGACGNEGCGVAPGSARRSIWRARRPALPSRLLPAPDSIAGSARGLADRSRDEGAQAHHVAEDMFEREPLDDTDPPSAPCCRILASRMRRSAGTAGSCAIPARFVREGDGLIAGVMVIAELLRRLHGGTALELVSGSASARDVTLH